jgi:hypothetical protein
LVHFLGRKQPKLGRLKILQLKERKLKQMGFDEVGNYERWEYCTEFVGAEAHKQVEFLQQKYPGSTFSKFAVQAAIPRLNELGDEGWELFHMEPVLLGTNADVRFLSGNDINAYTHTYFCVFKRRKRL